MTEPFRPVWLRRNRATAAEVERILGLPNGNWSDVEIEFGLDEPAIAKVSLWITAEQLTALAQLAAIPTQDGGQAVARDALSTKGMP